MLLFIIELFKNYSYSMWGKHCSFPRKLVLIATVFFSIWFFLYKIIFVNLIFFNIELVKNYNYK